jgi:gas vesicle protein
MKETGKIIGAVLLGAAAGIALGVLFAPGKGSETRKKLIDGAKDLAEDLKENFSETVNNILNKAEEAQEIAEGKLVEFKESIKENVDQINHV